MRRGIARFSGCCAACILVGEGMRGDREPVGEPPGPLPESENAFAEFLAPCGARHTCKEFLSAEPLHLAEDLLNPAPISNRLLQPLILLLGQGDTNRLAFDFAGPGITRTAAAGSPVLDIALTDPAGVGQLSTEAGILPLAG